MWYEIDEDEKNHPTDELTKKKKTSSAWSWLCDVSICIISVNRGDTIPCAYIDDTFGCPGIRLYI